MKKEGHRQRTVGERRELESPLQCAVASLLDYMGLLWCHVPNGRLRNPAVGRILKAEGVKRGVPDVLIFSRPPVYPNAVGVAIELKVGGGKLSTWQNEWIEALEKRGWIVHVCRSLEDVSIALRSAGFRVEIGQRTTNNNILGNSKNKP